MPGIIFAQQAKKAEKKYHYVPIQGSNDIYHDKSSCAVLQLTSGGKIRRIQEVGTLKPCKKCAKPIVEYSKSGFTNIKNVLGVRDRKQIVDSLGTAENVIHLPDGITLRISGPPDSRTVNQIEFYFDRAVLFSPDTLLSKKFFDRAGLHFENCKTDTIRNSAPHPVTGKTKKDFAIEYRGCAVVDRKDQYEDISKYYYELNFIPKETDALTYLDKLVLLLKFDR